MRLRFSKMQGAGNDFVMIDGIAQPFALDEQQLRRLADRRFGVGADQILVVETAQSSGNDFRYRIFNADGGEVEQCGNGARCFVRFVHDHRLTDKRVIRVETLGGVIEPRLEQNGQVTVDMGAPVFAPADVPFLAEGLVARIEGKGRVWPLEQQGGPVWVSVLSMGNPHAVQFVADVDAAPVASVGPELENHPRFPRRVNAGFAQLLGRHAVKLRVWERGVGETLACGTGACAAVVAGIERGLLDSPVTVVARGGDLQVAWDGRDASVAHPVLLTGPAVETFAGEIEV